MPPELFRELIVFVRDNRIKSDDDCACEKFIQHLSTGHSEIVGMYAKEYQEEIDMLISELAEESEPWENIMKDKRSGNTSIS